MEICDGTVLGHRYRLERLLGRGGMASVWRGHDRVLDRAVAVKVPSDAIASDPSFQARFRREATVAAALSHPNLVRVFDCAAAGERPYLVMELVPGEDLGALISRQEDVDRDRLARQLLAALAHIHGAGIVHRDVKPGNVLIEADGDAKLIDFGIALPPDATALTGTGLVLGTKSFAAPEVMRGEPAGVRSDLYSCGLVLAAGEGKGTPGLEALIGGLTAEDPAARPPSAQAALRELEAEDRDPGPLEQTAPFAVEPTTEPLEHLDGPTGRFRQPGSRNRPIDRRAGRGRRWAVALGLLAVIAAAAIVVATSLGGGSDGDSPRIAQNRAVAAAPAKHRAAERETAAAPDETPEAPEPEPEVAPEALNERGYELIQSGQYAEAVPVLEESVRGFPAGTADLEYAYALFNLGDALLRSGRAAEAIPVLEQRLRIPNQTEVVEAELDSARAAAAGSGE